MMDHRRRSAWTANLLLAVITVMAGIRDNKVTHDEKITAAAAAAIYSKYPITY